jgi:hypothetical protein
MFVSHLDPEVRVQQRLELKRLVTVIRNDERRAETVRVKRHAVQQAKLVRPQGLDLVVDGLPREAEVELDGGRGALGGRLAEELPARVAGEAVLGELGDGRVV